MDAQASFTSQDQGSSAVQPPVGTRRRPPAVVAMWLVVSSSVLGALAVLTDPMNAAKHQLVRNTERDTGVSVPLSAVDEQSGETQDLEFIYTVLASNTLLWAAVLGLLALIVGGGSRIARVFAYIVLTCTVLSKLLHSVVYFPAMTVICDVIAAGAAIAACFLLPRLRNRSARS